jgi:hypothetical protein
MLVCGIAFSGWYAQHTVLDTTRTERVATTVLSDSTVRTFIAAEIEPVVASASPTTAAALTNSGVPPAPGTPAAEPGAAATSKLADTLADPAIEADLSRFIGDVHRRVIGVGSGPVTLDQAAVDRLVTAAVPTIPPSELAKIPPVSFDVPRTSALSSSRRLVADHWWLIGIVGVALVAAGIATSDDRRDAVKLIGKWLIGLSLVQLVFLWIVPVWLVPAASDNVWVRVVAKVARALNGGLVVGLFVICAVGVAALFVDLFIPRTATEES